MHSQTTSSLVRFVRRPRHILGLGLGLLTTVLAATQGLAYPTYSDPVTGTTNCSGCHGDFRGTTSTKGTVFPGSNHDMHRGASNMGTACALCHTGTDRTIVFIGSSDGTANNSGLGCTGCHNPFGLRKHHRVNGVTVCGGCHTTDGIPPAETVKPPYYGTADTRANNPGNPVQVSGTNENWSVGDYLGLDNDGNNLYDLADYAVGPFRILSSAREGDNMRVTFLTAGGRTNQLQAAGIVSGTYTNIGAPVEILGVGLVTTNYLDVGGATNKTRYYRLKDQVP